MLKLMKDGTVREWEHSQNHPILAGVGTRFCVQVRDQNHETQFEQSVVRPNVRVVPLDDVLMTLNEPKDMIKEFNIEQLAREDSPWHYHLYVRIGISADRLLYQLVLTRREGCSVAGLMKVRFGVVPYFANHHDAWSVYQGELGRANDTNECPYRGMMFNPGNHNVRLETKRGHVVVSPSSGIDGIFLKADRDAGTVGLAPIAGFGKQIELEPGESAMTVATITYTPR